MGESLVSVTLQYSATDYDDRERDELAQGLLKQMRGIDDVDQCGLAIDAVSPPGSKSAGGFILGAVHAVLKVDALKVFFSFLSERLASKPIEMTIAAHGRTVTIKAHSAADFDRAMAAAVQLSATPPT